MMRVFLVKLLALPSLLNLLQRIVDEKVEIVEKTADVGCQLRHLYKSFLTNSKCFLDDSPSWINSILKQSPEAQKQFIDDAHRFVFSPALYFLKWLCSQLVKYLSIVKYIGKGILVIYNRCLFFYRLNKMAEYGYDKELFPNLTGDMFDCPICTNVVRNPKECTGCGDLFCGRCIDDWCKKNNSCPKRCKGGIQPMGSAALRRIYESLEMKCASCPKLVALSDMQNHKKKCGIPKCWNHDMCDGLEDPLFAKSCSQKCQLLQQLMNTGGNVKKMYDIILKYKPSGVSTKNVIKQERAVSSNHNTSSNNLRWDEGHCGLGLKFQNSGQLVILKEAAYVFRTAVANIGFSSGQHYWEITPDNRTENELKIGVTTTLAFDFNTAFCDHVFGFAYYGLGQLRHSSNASGPQYGKRLKKEGILGIFLNMDKGQLSFSLNGENMGVAFDNPALKKGPIYPAVALLHCAGCTIRGNIPIPACFR